MAEKKAETCAYPGCNCRVAMGRKFCSLYCESMFNQPSATCKCGHPECAAGETVGAAG
jgi:hypothetical protein